MSLSEYVLPVRINVGIQYLTDMGIVPELEEREAAVYCLIPWNEWYKLSWYDRSSMVAHYRMHLMIEAHIHDAEYQHMKQQQSRTKHR